MYVNSNDFFDFNLANRFDLQLKYVLVNTNIDYTYTFQAIKLNLQNEHR